MVVKHIWSSFAVNYLWKLSCVLQVDWCKLGLDYVEFAKTPPLHTCTFEQIWTTRRCPVAGVHTCKHCHAPVYRSWVFPNQMGVRIGWLCLHFLRGLREFYFFQELPDIFISDMNFNRMICIHICESWRCIAIVHYGNKKMFLTCFKWRTEITEEWSSVICRPYII